MADQAFLFSMFLEERVILYISMVLKTIDPLCKKFIKELREQ